MDLGSGRVFSTLTNKLLKNSITSQDIEGTSFLYLIRQSYLLRFISGLCSEVITQL
jgi:hypothetical protein